MTVYDVTFQREDHSHALHDWKLVDDVCEGEPKVKEGETTYLPMLNPSDLSEKNKKRYEGFLQRAVFYNVTGRTLDGLVGTAFLKDPVVTVPTGMDYVNENVDGHGVSVVQQAQATLANVLKKSRHCLFVDYPKTETDVSIAAQQRAGIRATCVSVDAENVINWRTSQIGALHLLTLVVIKESFTVISEDGFGQEEKPQYRALKLVEGVYTVEIWRQSEEGNDKTTWLLYDTYAPKNGKGSTWSFIPFTFVGAQNNDAKIDKPVLLDLATLNLAHYRNSALYEDSCYFVGHPQAFMTNLDEEWRDYLEEKQIVIGGGSLLPLPEGATFGFAQVGPNTMVKEAMDQKDDQMKALGARVLQPGQTVKTATEAQNDNETEHSVLSLAASNVSDAYNQILQWMGEFNNITGTIEFELSTDYSVHKLDAQMLTALVAAWQAGRLPSSDFWDQMREYGLVDPSKTNDQLDGEVEEDGTGLNLGGDDFESQAA